MALSGPAPKPQALKVLAGETRPSRLNRFEPRPREGQPRPPRTLRPAERRVWNRLVRELAPMRVLTPVDADQLLCLVTAIVRLAEAQADIAERGLIVPGVKDSMVRNPACIVEDSQRTVIAALSRRFGLDPASRAALQTKPDDPEPGDGILS